MRTNNRLTLSWLGSGRASRAARRPWHVQRQRGVEARERRIVDDELLQPVLHLRLRVREALLVDGGHHRRRFDAALREPHRASKAAFVENFTSRKSPVSDKQTTKYPR